jgi:hypothetical protein
VTAVLAGYVTAVLAGYALLASTARASSMSTSPPQACKCQAVRSVSLAVTSLARAYPRPGQDVPTLGLALCPWLQRLGVCGRDSLRRASEFEASGDLGQSRYGVHGPPSPWFFQVPCKRVKQLQACKDGTRRVVRRRRLRHPGVSGGGTGKNIFWGAACSLLTLGKLMYCRPSNGAESSK